MTRLKTKARCISHKNFIVRSSEIVIFVAPNYTVDQIAILSVKCFTVSYTFYGRNENVSHFKIGVQWIVQIIRWYIIQRYDTQHSKN